MIKLSPPGGQHYELLQPMVVAIYRQDQQALASSSIIMCGVSVTTTITSYSFLPYMSPWGIYFSLKSKMKAFLNRMSWNTRMGNVETLAFLSRADPSKWNLQLYELAFCTQQQTNRGDLASYAVVFLSLPLALLFTANTTQWCPASENVLNQSPCRDSEDVLLFWCCHLWTPKLSAAGPSNWQNLLFFQQLTSSPVGPAGPIGPSSPWKQMILILESTESLRQRETLASKKLNSRWCSGTIWWFLPCLPPSQGALLAPVNLWLLPFPGEGSCQI